MINSDSTPARQDWPEAIIITTMSDDTLTEVWLESYETRGNGIFSGKRLYDLTQTICAKTGEMNVDYVRQRILWLVRDELSRRYKNSFAEAKIRVYLNADVEPFVIVVPHGIDVNDNTAIQDWLETFIQPPIDYWEVVV